MQILQNRDLSPPDFFRYTHAETGHNTTAMDWYTWQTQIKDHRRDNSLPEISPAQAEDQLCQTLPPEWCQHAENNRQWVNTRLSWRDIVEGAKAYAKFALSGFQSVSQEEANRRAKICSSCYLSVPLQGCGACTAMATVITGSVAQKKTPYDDRLSRKACAACKCPTRSIVHFPLSLLEQADTPQIQAAFAPFCWRLKDGPNYLAQAA